MRAPGPARASARLVEWLSGQALPLWLDAGWDEAAGSFVERVGADAEPLFDLPRRAMVQARQIVSCVVASRRGWSRTAGERVEPAVASLVRRYHRSDGAPGWVFSVARDGRPVDASRDLYGHAFILLALAAGAEHTGNRALLALADETLGFLDKAMAAPGGGFRDALPAPADGRLRQNPHMHLLESLLALHLAAPGRGYLDRAAGLVDLLTGRFLQGPEAVLAEDFDEGWRPRGGPDFAFEPGHHFEWVWLLTTFQRLSGTPMDGVAAALWETALRFGVDADGTVFDEVSAGCGPLGRGTRLWPHAEFARAACCPLPRPARRINPDAVLTTLHRHFLDPAPAGSWVDHYDAGGRPMGEGAPASSLYHLVCAVDEVLRHEG